MLINILQNTNSQQQNLILNSVPLAVPWFNAFPKVRIVCIICLSFPDSLTYKYRQEIDLLRAGYQRSKKYYFTSLIKIYLSWSRINSIQVAPQITDLHVTRSYDVLKKAHI